MYIIKCSRLPLEILERLRIPPEHGAPDKTLYLAVDAKDAEDALILFTDNLFAFRGWLHYYEIDAITPLKNFDGEAIDCTHWTHWNEDGLEAYLEQYG